MERESGEEEEEDAGRTGEERDPQQGTDTGDGLSRAQMDGKQLECTV